MKITYDPVKRGLTLEHRGLDFEQATYLFAGRHYTYPDERRDYGEERQISVGMIDAAVIVTVWTWRGDQRRIISMRKADRDERRHYQEWLDRP